TSPTTEDTIDFTDESTDNDGSIEEWSWDFGDGATSTSQNPSHSYDTADTYTVELTVTDDDGATDTTTQDITVEEDSGGEYCTVEGGDTSYGEYITNVQFNGINRDSDDDGGYADHTGSISDPVEPGQSYELSVTLSTGGYSDYVSVVIDWDQDYDLSDDTVVEVGSGSNDPQTVSKTITVPSDAAEGQTRMRVMQEYDEYHTDPCSNQNYGETEDYTIDVSTTSSLSEVEMNSMSHHTELDLEQEDIQSLDIQSPIDHDVVSPTKIKDL
ncbi:MAG: GEVED domain-containing protein, partial [Candidatus Natronoplasma sp.]